MQQDAIIRDGRDLGAFIPAHLDDYGLSPYEFRLYAHIARRAGAGQCWEGVTNMAAACRMNVKTVRAATKRLAELKLIHIQFREGQTNVITLTAHSQWLPYSTPTLSGSPTELGTPTGTGTPPLPDKVAPPLPNQVPKGTPIEGYPYEGTPIKAVQKNAREVVEVEACWKEEGSDDPPVLNQGNLRPADQSDNSCSGLVLPAPRKSAVAKFEESFQSRMRVDPWMECDPQVKQLFIEYVAGCYGDRRESQAKKMNVARTMLRKAGSSDKIAEEYKRIDELWNAFVENLQQARSLDQAIGKANTLDPEIREMMSK